MSYSFKTESKRSVNLYSRAKALSVLNLSFITCGFDLQVSQLFKEKKEHDPSEIDRIMSKILTHCQNQLLKSESLVTPDGRPNMERIKT